MSPPWSPAPSVFRDSAGSSSAKSPNLAILAARCSASVSEEHRLQDRGCLVNHVRILAALAEMTLTVLLARSASKPLGCRCRGTYEVYEVALSQLK